jgi:hypothetical protein
MFPVFLDCPFLRGLTAKSKEATIPYPPSLFKTYIEKRQVKSIQEGFEKSRYSQTIRVFKDKFRFDPECILSSKYALTEIPYVRGHIRSLINSGLCPYITAPLRTAATASLGQICVPGYGTIGRTSNSWKKQF